MGEQFGELPLALSELEVIFVLHIRSGNRIQIIGAREVTQSERKQYEAGIGKEEQQPQT
jgi:uncharacterized DUF497 family protein